VAQATKTTHEARGQRVLPWSGEREKSSGESFALDHGARLSHGTLCWDESGARGARVGQGRRRRRRPEGLALRGPVVWRRMLGVEPGPRAGLLPAWVLLASTVVGVAPTVAVADLRLASLSAGACPVTQHPQTASVRLGGSVTLWVEVARLRL